LRKMSNIRLISKYFTPFGAMTHCFKTATFAIPLL
jgi:hypothetical protein